MLGYNVFSFFFSIGRQGTVLALTHRPTLLSYYSSFLPVFINQAEYQMGIIGYLLSGR